MSIRRVSDLEIKPGIRAREMDCKIYKHKVTGAELAISETLPDGSFTIVLPDGSQINHNHALDRTIRFDTKGNHQLIFEPFDIYLDRILDELAGNGNNTRIPLS